MNSNSNSAQFDLIVIGGGAAGFFTAICFAEKNPGAAVLILESSNDVLGKVRVSGGGRCNVTHHCFEPSALIQHYPRGQKELRGPFSRFGPAETIQWFESHGVPLKTEEDGRMFPRANTSEAVIKLFKQCCRDHNIQIHCSERVELFRPEDIGWFVKSSRAAYLSNALMVATGSDRRTWDILVSMGHHMIAPVASLYTFNISEKALHELSGISVMKAKVSIRHTNYQAEGPLLITHWGLSGPVILKLSAWAARELMELAYKFDIDINWIALSLEHALEQMQNIRQQHSSKLVLNTPLFSLPQRLWRMLLWRSGMNEESNWQSMSASNLRQLASVLCQDHYKVNGKSTYKQEFVTAGGVDLKEINFKRFESRLHPGLFLAGEILNIDALTGGFNFQAAWTGAWIAAEAMSEDLITKG
ncbi:MAG: NAD(P)/FAD-dependent oxidoreductase [Saprospiraceae bacterium]|nr:NAD(P)/FAD-dependent oxidoreductase [Saprospiraceae bacterium]HMW39169.1 NAD(P)/FAD-dependent oxidoreductase [Saprospiraceae bacterium]HMX89448.1 NAD(P)/FAD-dependent oxidoreductase [Saprospiraceae bacterium]HMZ41266.1 NAD(P)/FAD-dependent oxidoreductase [Saprospiraceae bacterium]HNA64631.1 NAD(P)/FAD-dependent oxidoreductase [Saprospiraceae bacterium]